MRSAASAGCTFVYDPHCDLSARLLRLEQSQLAAHADRRRPAARNVARATGDVRVLAGTDEDFQTVTVCDGFQTLHDLKARPSWKRNHPAVARVDRQRLATGEAVQHSIEHCSAFDVPP